MAVAEGQLKEEKGEGGYTDEDVKNITKAFDEYEYVYFTFDKTLESKMYLFVFTLHDKEKEMLTKNAFPV